MKHISICIFTPVVSHAQKRYRQRLMQVEKLAEQLQRTDRCTTAAYFPPEDALRKSLAIKDSRAVNAASCSVDVNGVFLPYGSI